MVTGPRRERNAAAAPEALQFSADESLVDDRSRRRITDATSPPQPETTRPPVCRQCGRTLTADTKLCDVCGVSLALDVLSREDRRHTWDMVIAIVVFGVANAGVIVVTGVEFWQLEAMIFRFFLLGVPAAAVLWNWYRLMLVPDPDYGELWHTYWTIQIFTFVLLLGLPLLITLIYMTSQLMLMVL